MVNAVWGFPDPEDLVCTYLNPLCPGNVRPKMPNGASLPFIVVRCTTTPSDGLTAYASVQLEFFQSDYSAAKDLAREGHSLMLDIKSAPINVNGTPVSIDRLQFGDGPIWVDYGDENLQRFVCRYQLDTRITAL